ncbi:MAG TPA: anti-sigma factor antagonist [Coriobacteriia bacterium]
MSVTIERSGDSPACIARIHGDIDLASAPEVRNAVDGAISSGCSYVVLDLADVPYADSSALGLLVWMDRRLNPRHGRLVLAGADHNVSRILEISGLLGVAPSITTASGVDEALGGLPMEAAAAVPNWEHRLLAPADASAVSELRGRICGLIEPLGLTDSALFDLRVAVGEALANAVRHGSPGGPRDEVESTVSAYDDRVVVSIRDHGVGFDGAGDGGTDVFASGGRGVTFMRALTDRVEFSRCEDGGTLVRLTKRVAADRSHAAAGHDRAEG